MENKKVANLLRAVADLMEETTNNIIETNKNAVEKVMETTQKVVNETVNNQKEFLEHSLKLMKKIEETDSIRAYQNRLAKKNTELKDALEEIQKMREQAIKDMITDSMEVLTDPSDFIKKSVKNLSKVGKQMTEETKIISKVFNP